MVFIKNNSNSGVSCIQTAGVMFIIKEDWMSERKCFFDIDWSDADIDGQLQQSKDVEINCHN